MDYKFEAEDVIREGRTQQQSVSSIKAWMSKNSDLPTIPDQLIVLFLLSCENNIEFTQTTIRAYFECKKNTPEMFDDRDMERNDVKKALSTINLATLPVRTKDNNAIEFFKLVDTSYNNFLLVPLMKISYMLLDITQEVNPPNGLVVVIDMKGAGILHMSKIKLGPIRKYFQFLQEGMPIKLKAIYIINAVYFFDKILAMVRVFIKTELLEMLKVYPSGMNMEEFFQNEIPASHMPKEYGGDLPSMHELNEKCLEQMKARQPFYDAEEKMRKKMCL